MRIAAAVLGVALLLLSGVALAQETRVIADAKYGKEGDEQQVFTIHIPASEKPAPVMVLINSGGWTSGRAGAEAKISPVGAEFLKAGFAVAQVNHRDVTRFPWPAQIDDVARAIQFLRSKAGEWNIDPSRISVWGRSSGGHLSMMAGFLPDRAKPESEDPVERQSSRITCVVEQVGPADLVAMVKGMIKQGEEGKPGLTPYLRETFAKLVGMKPEQVASEEFYKKLAELSPLNYVGKNTPPVFMVYMGPEDATSPDDPRLTWDAHTAISGLQLAQKFKENGVPYELFMAPDRADRQEEVMRRQIAFVKKHNGIE